ncbi:MAG TPA: hypothetical protein VGL56_08240 [Fimbriimonadaceae bacterium]|jgi:hypothetical protein
MMSKPIRKTLKTLGASAVLLAGFSFFGGACGGGGSQPASLASAPTVVAQATNYPDNSGGPAIKLTFANFPSGPYAAGIQYVIYRNYAADSPPTQVSTSAQSFAYDDTNSRNFNYYSAPLIQSAAGACSAATSTAGTATGIAPGVPYSYTVQEVYTSGACSYETAPIASGIATPLGATSLISPADGQNVYMFVPFTFSSLVGTAPITVQYVLQISNAPQFPKATTYTSPPLVTGNPNNQSISLQPTKINELLQDFLTANGVPASPTYWWRIGARNIADVPGPVPDPTTGEAYVFCSPAKFQIPGSTMTRRH